MPCCTPLVYPGRVLGQVVAVSPEAEDGRDEKSSTGPRPGPRAGAGATGGADSTWTITSAPSGKGSGSKSTIPPCATLPRLDRTPWLTTGKSDPPARCPVPRTQREEFEADQPGESSIGGARFRSRTWPRFREVADRVAGRRAFGRYPGAGGRLSGSEYCRTPSAKPHPAMARTEEHAVEWVDRGVRGWGDENSGLHRLAAHPGFVAPRWAVELPPHRLHRDTLTSWRTSPSRRVHGPDPRTRRWPRASAARPSPPGSAPSP